MSCFPEILERSAPLALASLLLWLGCAPSPEPPGASPESDRSASGEIGTAAGETAGVDRLVAEIPAPSPPGVTHLPNANVSQFQGSQAEMSIAVDRFDPLRVVVASVNLGSGDVLVGSSSDGGVNWSRTLVPKSPDATTHFDPMVAFDSRGVAHLAHIPVQRGSIRGIEVNRSTDGGRTWSPSLRISDATGRDDKVIVRADDNPESPFRDNVYVAWKWPPGPTFFSRSEDGGLSYTPRQQIASFGPSGLDLAVSSEGVIYLSVTNGGPGLVQVMRSLDGGVSFEPPVTVAPARGGFYTMTPSVCIRHALIHTSVAVDRSHGERHGTVYLTWSDYAEGSPANCSDSCSPQVACTTDVFFSRSTDGGVSWSQPELVHEADLGNADQYHQWADVDPADGALYVAYKDTRDDPQRRETHVYLSRSLDGGESWEPSLRVSTAPSYTDFAFQYGDYQGLAVAEGRAYAAWGDYRDDPNNAELYVSTTIFDSEAEDPCPLALGHRRFCKRCGPCAEGEGGCKRDRDCEEDLTCVARVGDLFGFDERSGVCLPECDFTLGDRRYCRRCGPCGEGQGGCKKDAHCAPGLVCVAGVGADFGFDPRSGVCLGP